MHIAVRDGYREDDLLPCEHNRPARRLKAYEYHSDATESIFGYDGGEVCDGNGAGVGS